MHIHPNRSASLKRRSLILYKDQGFYPFLCVLFISPKQRTYHFQSQGFNAAAQSGRSTLNSRSPRPMQSKFSPELTDDEASYFERTGSYPIGWIEHTNDPSYCKIKWKVILPYYETMSKISLVYFAKTGLR